MSVLFLSYKNIIKVLYYLKQQHLNNLFYIKRLTFIIFELKRMNEQSKGHRKTLQIYFRGFADSLFNMKPDDLRRIFIKGIIEYAKDIDEFSDMVTTSNTFNIYHYDKINNIVTFTDGKKKKAVILPFIKDDLNYDIDIAFCFITTREFILNAKGNLIPVKYLVLLDPAMFNSLFKENEKNMLPVDFLHCVRKMYMNVLSKEPLEINTVQTIEKYISEDKMSINMIRGLVENRPIREIQENGDVNSILNEINSKLDLIINKNGGIKNDEEKYVSKSKKTHLQVL